MDKHAYLIMIHGNFENLSVCLSLLDDDRNDIYIHVDKKVKEEDLKKVKDEIEKRVQKSHVFYTKRINVKWGTDSIMRATLILLKAAIKGEYAYYHLLSGADLPIKSQDYIHDFFAKHNGKEFVSFNRESASPESLKSVQYYYFGDRRKRFPGFLLKVQRKLGVNRLKKNIVYQKGGSWFSITDKLATYIVSKEKEIKKLFRHTWTCDEIFLQTMVINSDFKNSLWDKDFEDHGRRSADSKKPQGNMRTLIWDTVSDAHPINLTMKQLDYLKESEALYARKFDWKCDSEVICTVYEMLTQKEWK